MRRPSNEGLRTHCMRMHVNLRYFLVTFIYSHKFLRDMLVYSHVMNQAHHSANWAFVMLVLVYDVRLAYLCPVQDG